GDVYRFSDLFELGDIAGSAAAVDGLVRISKETHERAMAVWSEIFRTALELLGGELESAEARSMKWFADHRGISDTLALRIFGVQFFDLRRAQGRCAEVEPPIRALVAENPDEAGWRAGLTMLLTELDARDEVEELFEGLAENDFAGLTESPSTY